MLKQVLNDKQKQMKIINYKWIQAFTVQEQIYQKLRKKEKKRNPLNNNN